MCANEDKIIMQLPLGSALVFLMNLNLNLTLSQLRMNGNVTGLLILDANECCEIEKKKLIASKIIKIKLGQLHFETNIWY